MNLSEKSIKNLKDIFFRVLLLVFFIISYQLCIEFNNSQCDPSLSLLIRFGCAVGILYSLWLLIYVIVKTIDIISDLKNI